VVDALYKLHNTANAVAEYGEGNLLKGTAPGNTIKGDVAKCKLSKAVCVMPYPNLIL